MSMLEVVEKSVHCCVGLAHQDRGYLMVFSDLTGRLRKVVKLDTLQDLLGTLTTGNVKQSEFLTSASLRVPRPRNSIGPQIPQLQPPADITRFTANATVSCAIILFEQSNRKLTNTDG